MKLKFRAETKDVVRFLIFAAVLFILICIAVANVGMLVSEGELAGLNFIPAITKYTAVTFVFFIIAVIAMFLSVQSWFIEREEGFGIQNPLRLSQKALIIFAKH